MTSSHYHSYRLLNWRRLFWPWHFFFDCPPNRVHKRLAPGRVVYQCECGYREIQVPGGWIVFGEERAP